MNKAVSRKLVGRMARFGEMNVLIVCARRPFERSSVDVFVRALQEGMGDSGVRVDVIEQPICDQPLQTLLHQVSLWRMLDLRVFNGAKIDVVIAVNFPACTINHPFKISWFTEDFAEFAGDVSSTGRGEPDSRTEYVRQMLLGAFQTGVRESRGVFATTDRLAVHIRELSDVPVTELSPPLPHGDQYDDVAVEDFLIGVGDLSATSRLDILVRALMLMPESCTLRLIYDSVDESYETYLKSEIDQMRLWSRVELVPQQEHARVLDLFSRARAVFFAPQEQAFSFAPFEAFASSRPVLTTFDCPFGREVVKDEGNGLITEPNPQAIALAWKRLLSDDPLYSTLREGARHSARSNDWAKVFQALFGKLSDAGAAFVPSGEESNVIKTITLEQLLAEKAVPEKVETAEVFFKREANT